MMQSTHTLTLEELIQHIIASLYPSCIFHLSKVIILSSDVVAVIKKQAITVAETQGTNYFFWCWVDIYEPSQRFAFGQITIHHPYISWDVCESNFQKWARQAYTRKWFDLEDVRIFPITYLPTGEKGL